MLIFIARMESAIDDRVVISSFVVISPMPKQRLARLNVPWYHGCFLYLSFFRVHFHSQRLIEVTQAILMISIEFVHLCFSSKCKVFALFLHFTCTYCTIFHSKYQLFISFLRLVERKKQTLFNLHISKYGYNYYTTISYTNTIGFRKI